MNNLQEIPLYNSTEFKMPLKLRRTRYKNIHNIFCSQTIINYNINTIIKLQILSCKNLSQTTSKSVQSVILFLYRVPNVENSNIVIKADLNRQTFMKY